jgi:hypothetical protein
MIALILFLFRKRGITVNFVLVVSLFLTIELVQYIYFSDIGLRTIAGTYLRLFFVYFVVATIGSKYIDVYLKQLYFFSVVGLVLYPMVFFSDLVNFTYSYITPYFDPLFSQNIANRESSLIIWSMPYKHISDLRNSGPFWEPGGFATFLLLGSIFRLQLNGVKMDKYMAVFIVSLITTVSTVAYLGLNIILYMIYTRNSNLYIKIIFVPFFVIITYIAFVNVEILSTKIERNIEIADQTTGSRFGSAMADYELFKDSPIIGYGRGTNRYASTYSDVVEMEHRNNGLTNLAVTYGVIMFIIIFYMYYYSFSKYVIGLNKNYNLSLYFMLIITLCSFSQILFMRSFVLSLLFLPSVYNSMSNTKNTIK